MVVNAPHDERREVRDAARRRNQMNGTLKGPASRAHTAILYILVTISSGCYRSHLIGAPVDGGEDVDIVDAHLFDSASDAAQRDSGDASRDMTVLECPTGLGGTWYATYGHSCLGTDGFIELSDTGMQSIVDGVCSQPGCSAENCETSSPIAPECTSFVRWTSPCWGAPRGVSTEISYHFMSATRFEGTWALIAPGSVCEEHVVGTR